MSQDQATPGNGQVTPSSGGLPGPKRKKIASIGIESTEDWIKRAAFLMDGMLAGYVPVHMAQAGGALINSAANMQNLACRFGTITDDGRYVLPMLPSDDVVNETHGPSREE